MTSQYGAYAFHAERAMLHACTSPRAPAQARTRARTHTHTHTHTHKCVAFIAFPRQKWFATVPQCYVIRTLSVLLYLINQIINTLYLGNIPNSLHWIKTPICFGSQGVTINLKRRAHNYTHEIQLCKYSVKLHKYLDVRGFKYPINIHQNQLGIFHLLHPRFPTCVFIGLL